MNDVNRLLQAALLANTPSLAAEIYFLVGQCSVWLLILFSFYQSWWTRRDTRRREAGHCPICDYDLRATPDGCPECGNRDVKRRNAVSVSGRGV